MEIGRRIQLQSSRSLAQGSGPSPAPHACAIGCVNGPAHLPHCIHCPASPLAWISPASIKLPIKTNFPLIIEKRKTKEKALAQMALL